MPHAAVIITGPGFQDHDVVYAYYRLKEARFEVDVATAGDEATGTGIHVTGKYGVSVPLDKTAREPIAFTALADEDAVARYDLVVLTGGHEAPDRVRQDDDVKAFIRSMDDAGKVVAGLCHGPWIMISAGIMRGRRACAYIGMRDDMVHAGAHVVDDEIVIDDNIVTCSYYGEVGAFMKATIELVQERAVNGEPAAWTRVLRRQRAGTPRLGGTRLRRAASVVLSARRQS
jgi:protease I